MSLFLVVSLLLALPQEAPRDDWAIAKSTTLPSGIHRVADVQADGLIRVKGDGIVLDFGGATLIGAPDGEMPNNYKGFAVLIESSTNVVVKNLKAQRFKIGILARDVRGLKIENCQFSDMWRQRLMSTPDRESDADRLAPFENDAEQWQRYGAAICALRCPGATITGSTARNGQNGTILSSSDGAVVADNDFSFLSGWGLALWRTSKADVSNNTFDWCVRGFSQKVYERGHESAGIVVLEQCSDNVFAYNSATHSGRGAFVSSGLETIERTGLGGSNRNVFYRNDFSFAVVAGIEASCTTGDRIVENILEGSDAGVRSQFGSDILVLGNTVARCRIGLAVEHGLGVVVEGNVFRENGSAVELTNDATHPLLAKPFGKTRGKGSSGFAIRRNSFGGDARALGLRDALEVDLKNNAFEKVGILVKAEGESTARIEANNIDARSNEVAAAGVVFGPNHAARDGFGVRAAAPYPPIAAVAAFEAPKTAGTRSAFQAKGAPRGRRFIFIEPWGPYDFSGVKIVPQRQSSWGDAAFRILGPDLPFEVTSETPGVLVQPKSGRTPAVLTVSSVDGKQHAFAFGVKTSASPNEVRAEGILWRTTWKTKWFRCDGDAADPAKFAAGAAAAPLVEEVRSTVDFSAGLGAPRDGVPSDGFGMTAESDMVFDAGEYRFRTVADDGVRVYVDGAVVIDDWSRHAPTERTAALKLAAGTHRIRIEYFEGDGSATLEFAVEPAVP